MRFLIVDDDFINRHVLRQIMTHYGDCDVAVNGLEAVETFKINIAADKSYSLVLLDIMMPEMDGLETLRRIRDIEAAAGVLGSRGVKVVMTTALSDSKSIMLAFKSQCESYIVKPITKDKLDAELIKLGLIPRPTATASV